MEWLVSFFTSIPNEAFRALAIPSLLLNAYLLYELRNVFNGTIQLYKEDNATLRDQVGKGLTADNRALKEAIELLRLLETKGPQRP